MVGIELCLPRQRCRKGSQTDLARADSDVRPCVASESSRPQSVRCARRSAKRIGLSPPVACNALKVHAAKNLSPPARARLSLPPSRPVTEGCLYSIFRCRAGSGGRGMTWCRRCNTKARRSKPRLIPARLPRAEGPDGRYGRRPVRGRQPECLALNGGELRPFNRVQRDERSTTGDSAEQAFKHRARDALGLADLRNIGLRQASMSRGAEARGSEHFLFAHSA